MKNPEPALRRSTQLSQSLGQLQELIGQMADELNNVPPPRMSRSGPFLELQQSLPSQIQAISPFVTHLMRSLANSRNGAGGEVEIEMALREGLANAVVHGNHEDPHKRVHVVCRCSIDGDVSITIRDQGRGFDSRAVPDPTTADNLQSEHGRGIFLMRAFMDEVSFSDGGTAVHMRKKSNVGSAVQGEAQ